ncbi:MAG: T9SS C-terminal target domain-containing protein [Flavobacteriales bacterium]|nr:T9SS C-terminal target domain-containing protein [Crocinitomicaceae bacterium]NBX79668.1 T9SS C-terminal target domain-containing protein [Flavobacteriales bacterium]
MKSKIVAIVLGIGFFYSNAFGYYGPNDKPGKVKSNPKGANCSPATSKLTMEFNDVKALIEQGGSMFQNRAASVSAYEVPKGSNRFAIFAGALWMGGTDVNGQLKLAALRFRSGNDFWPGPLTVTPGTGTYNPGSPVGDNAVRDFGEANIDPDQCLAYDKFYTIRKAEVIRFNIWWECNAGITTEGCDDVVQPSNDELNRIYSWPAHGDVSRGQDYFLAPFYDRDGDGNYNPDNGDHPWYDDILGRDDIECGVDRRVSLYGDETHWWVFNDKGNIHTETNGDPIGMEIRAQAFSFATNDEVNRMTFYNYELINRGTQTLFNTYFAQYLDCDLGNYADDYVGCDVSRGLGYTFNGDNNDQSDGGRLGYGENPPAIGCDFFEGPYQDGDGIDNPGPYFDEATQTDIVPSVIDALANGGIVYKGIGIGYSDGIIDNERFGMRRFSYYTSTSAYPYNDPGSASEYYNFMQGLWANGSQMFYGGLGYVGSIGVTTAPSSYMFPGTSDPIHWSTNGVDMSGAFPNGWDESTNNNPSGDRRFVQSAGPFTLRPGAINNITVGIVYGRSTDGNLFASVDAMKRADTKAQALFDACFKILSPPDAPKLTIQELENELILVLENPSSSNNYQEAYSEMDEINIPDPTVDRYYRFEGYQIFQLKSTDVSIADITDPTKARLVAQCDIKNNIGRIINFEFDENLGFSVPVEKVNGANKGIQHSFKVTEDQFAQGNRTLVNHKTYYYVAIAYAYNQFKKYDPNDATLLDGQKIPFISSRLNYDGTAISSIPAVPHNPIPEAGGTEQLIEYGSSPQITRLDGYGNGNRSLELTSSSLASIIEDGFMENPTYDYGKGPINIKVVDPLNLANGYFECKFRDYNVGTTGNAADTASWVIYRYDQKGGNIIDSVSSERTIAVNNEQIIPEWGISVQIYQEKYYFPSGSGNPAAKFTDMIESSIEFADSSKRWLSGVQDNDAFFPTNWIRSGDYKDTNSTPNVAEYLNAVNYKDELGADPAQKYESILNGTIAPHRLVGYQADYMPLAYYNSASAPGASKANASISFLPSVNIVITSDKSKWTRCPVIELGRTESLNIGGAKSGAMRKSQSVDKNGIADGTGTGMGWFPGYAVDLESGARLYMAFGENSFLGGENGADMIWNPTDRIVSNVGTPLMGGMHPIYVFGYNQATINGYVSGYDFPAYIPNQAETNATNLLYQKWLEVETNNAAAKRELYGSLSWIAYPLLNTDQTLLSTDVTIKLRINKEFKNFVGSGENGGKPMYSWSMDEIATVVASKDQLKEALKMINIVPNPYYAFSEYERTRIETKVKITNLPEKCTVRIYTSNGKLVRTFKKDSPVTSLDWDLTNNKAIPVAGGIYLIHVEVPEVGEVILKFFGGMRQVDLQGI